VVCRPPNIATAHPTIAVLAVAIVVVVSQTREEREVVLTLAAGPKKEPAFDDHGPC
jgi:hypothetical protein